MIPRNKRSPMVWRIGFNLLLLTTLASCTSVPLSQGTSLGSNAGMTKSGGTLTQAKLRVDHQAVLAAKSIRIVPTSFARIPDGSFDKADLALLTNAIDRSLCINLSDRFHVVAADQPADLVVHATITGIVATNQTAAATSAVAALGAAALQVPVPRLPVGLGGLAVEAEATGNDGMQKAAMVWSQGANMLTTKARVSKVGDAYSLASTFTGDFSGLLIKAADPFKQLITLPSMKRINAALGASPKNGACKAFGATPGITGAVAGQLGLPPGWTDKGAVSGH